MFMNVVMHRLIRLPFRRASSFSCSRVWRPDSTGVLIAKMDGGF